MLGLHKVMNKTFLLSVFIFTTFTFQAFVSIFMEVLKNCHRKIKLLERKLVLFKRRLFFQKQMRDFLKKKLLLNICVLLTILCILNSDSYLTNFFFICFNDSPSIMMQNAFYFILKAIFFLKIFNFLS